MVIELSIRLICKVEFTKGHWGRWKSRILIVQHQTLFFYFILGDVEVEGSS